SQDEHKKTNHRYSASQLFRPNTLISAASTRFTANSSTNSRLQFPHSSVIKQHLEELLYLLSFSDQLACQIVKDPHQRTGKSTSNVLEDTLLTKFVLGQYVGHQWELEKIMRWRELAPPSSSPCTSKIDASQPQSFHGTGLWTARGHVVEAIVGAVMAE
ncbi:hypothetical protein MJO28_001009, partial [Puccinia striiformis f. sp. tritici]